MYHRSRVDSSQSTIMKMLRVRCAYLRCLYHSSISISISSVWTGTNRNSLTTAGV